MTPFKRKKKKEEKEPEDAIGPELDKPSMLVRFMQLTGLMDVPTITEEVRKGNLVVMDVNPLVQQGADLKLQLKRAIDQLRAVTFSVDGDIGQLGNRYIVLTPGRVKIYRDSPVEEED